MMRPEMKDDGSETPTVVLTRHMSAGARGKRWLDDILTEANITDAQFGAACMEDEELDWVRPVVVTRWREGRTPFGQDVLTLAVIKALEAGLSPERLTELLVGA